MGIDIKDDDSLDEIFVEIGEFRLYQVLLMSLLAFPCILSLGYMYEFVFATATLNYR